MVFAGMSSRALLSFFFFFNDTATTEIYTLSLHDALPISSLLPKKPPCDGISLPCESTTRRTLTVSVVLSRVSTARMRSEEHTSELQSLTNLVCRLLLEKKNKHYKQYYLRGETQDAQMERT